MRVVVTGAAGFIASRLTERLIADGHHVRVVDHQPPALPWRQRVWDAAAERMTLDLRDPHAGLIAVEHTDWVFHLAATVGGVGFLGKRDYRPFFDNMRMSLNVLDACERWDVERMFYAGSSCTYPVHMQMHHTWRPLCEHHMEYGHPDLVYGREKLVTTRLCERAPFDARVGIFNTIFGPGLKLTGERMKYPAAVVTRAIDAIAAGVPLEVWGDGSQVRGYLHVDDCIAKVMRIMSEPYDGPVNVTANQVASCDEVARMVLDILGHPDHPITHVRGLTGPMHRQVSNAKWEQTYGPDPQRTTREAFEDFVTWVQANR